MAGLTIQSSEMAIGQLLNFVSKPHEKLDLSNKKRDSFMHITRALRSRICNASVSY